MGAVVLILTWACATGIVTTASRMTWSFARDKGTPFSHVLSKVSRKRRIPVVALCVATGFACLLTLIYVGSYTAFNDVISLTVTGFYSSYLLPAGFLLYHRVKGNIQPHAAIQGTDIDPEVSPEMAAAGDGEKKVDDKTDAPVIDPRRRQSSVAQIDLMWGPFHLPGWFGIANNAYACLYMMFVIFWSVWPPEADTNYENMNYSVVVTGGVIIFSIIWYYVRGKKEYQGPTVDEEVEEVMRRGSVMRRASLQS